MCLLLCVCFDKPFLISSLFLLPNRSAVPSAHTHSLLFWSTLADPFGCQAVSTLIWSIHLLTQLAVSILSIVYSKDMAFLSYLMCVIGAG